VSRAIEICIAFLGRGIFGRGGIIFNRLAWWLTESGVAERMRLENDPAWQGPFIVGFDAEGYPLEFSPEVEDRIRAMFRRTVSRHLRPAEAENLVRETVQSGLEGVRVSSKNRREKARIRMLRRTYDNRHEAWPDTVS
jgi:hypothetical protein